jgi:cysteine desulfurase
MSRLAVDAGEAIEGSPTLGLPLQPIYLDYQATTPMNPAVLAAMLPFMQGFAGNPHSTGHAHGQAAFAAVEAARVEVAATIGASADELIITSGATEANNLLIRGAAAAGARVGRTKIVTCVTEHKAVLEVARRLARDGFEVAEVGVDGGGIIDLDRLHSALDERTALVSVMAANNEIGVLQPIGDIGHACRAAGALFHTDAAQAVGKVPIDVEAACIDLLSLSGHKLYGPMGIGAAYIARRAGRRVEPLLFGGGQENGFRSGTLPVPLCVGLGEACRIARASMMTEAERLRELRQLFLQELEGAGVAFVVNGAMDPRLPGNINLSFEGVDAEALLMVLRGRMSIASGSACTARALEPSHVVAALGGSAERAEEAVRVGFGRPTTEPEVVEAARFIAEAVAKLQAVSYRPAARGDVS